MSSIQGRKTNKEERGNSKILDEKEEHNPDYQSDA